MEHFETALKDLQDKHDIVLEYKSPLDGIGAALKNMLTPRTLAGQAQHEQTSHGFYIEIENRDDLQKTIKALYPQWTPTQVMRYASGIPPDQDEIKKYSRLTGFEDLFKVERKVVGKGNPADAPVDDTTNLNAANVQDSGGAAPKEQLVLTGMTPTTRAAVLMSYNIKKELEGELKKNPAYPIKLTNFGQYLDASDFVQESCVSFSELAILIQEATQKLDDKTLNTVRAVTGNKAVTNQQAIDLFNAFQTYAQSQSSSKSKPVQNAVETKKKGNTYPTNLTAEQMQQAVNLVFKNARAQRCAIMMDAKTEKPIWGDAAGMRNKLSAAGQRLAPFAKAAGVAGAAAGTVLAAGAAGVAGGLSQAYGGQSGMTTVS